MVEFEEKAGMPTSVAFREMLQGNMSFKVIATLLWAGIKGQAVFENRPEKALKWQVVGEMVRKDGITSHFKNAKEFLSNAVLSEEDQKRAEEPDEGESEAVGSKKNT